MQTSHSANESSSQDAIKILRQSVEKTLDQNRALLTEMAHFTKAESLRMAQRNLDHANHAIAHFDERRDLAGLIEAQQEWIKEMMQDYASLSLRYAEMFRSLTDSMRQRAEHGAAEFAAEAEETAETLRQTGEAAMHDVHRAAE